MSTTSTQITHETMPRLGRRASLGRTTGAILAAAALTLGAGCGAEPIQTENEVIDTAASDLTLHQLQQSFVSACSATVRATYGAAFPGSCTVSNFTRTVIDASQSIVEYKVDVQVGPGAHDSIGLHRVVKETSAYTPAVSSIGVMLTHGDAWAFRAAFLDTGAGDTFAAFLAKNNIDVWGIDLRWTRVPAATADFSFMSGWGINTDAQDLRLALSIARINRNITGSGAVKMKLLGWSRGGQIGYAYLGNEAALPTTQRHVNGFIPVDIYLKTDTSTTTGTKERDDACARLATSRAQFNDANKPDRYYSPLGYLAATLGQLAIIDPGGHLEQPLLHHLAGLSNEEAALFIGEKTFAIQAPHQPTPFYHLVGGTFDATNDHPNGLTYTNKARWFSVETQAAPYEPIKVLIDADAATCGDPADTISASLSAITVPVLYVGAAGGFGDRGLYTTSLLGSSSKSSIVVSLTPDQLSNIGHSDIFLAQNAQSLFWDGILDWLEGPLECQTSNDCVLYSNNESCTCLAEPIGTPPPHDDGSLCAIDPCLNKTPVCQNSICVVSSGSDG